jgi:hypothetical protein
LGASDEELRRAALRELDGVGDESLGQWFERGRLALHVRRRLSRDEQLLIGDVCDLRHTAEAWRRLREASEWLDARGQQFAMEELTTCQTSS